MTVSYFRKDIMPKVTRYNYTINDFVGIDGESDENSLDLGCATYAYNVCLKNGNLTQGMGITLPMHKGNLLPLPGNYATRVSQTFFFRHYDYVLGKSDDRILLTLSDGTLLEGKINDTQYTELTAFPIAPSRLTFLNYHYDDKDCVIIIGANGTTCTYDGATFSAVSVCPNITEACAHNGRIFGVCERDNRIYYTSELNPTDWTVGADAGGYVSFPDEGGKVKRVTPFGGQLYIFREYAIHRFSTLGDQLDYSLTKVVSTNNLIYHKTVAVCNSCIIYLAEDGFFSFDGYNIKKKFGGINALIKNKFYSVACYFNNQYYLATYFKHYDELIGDEARNKNDLYNNGIIAIDMFDGSYNIMRGADVNSFMTMNFSDVNLLVVNFNNFYNMCNLGMIDESGKLFNENLPKYWRGAYTDLGKLDTEKVLRRIYVSSSGAFDLKAKLDKTYAYTVFSSGKTAMYPVNKKAEKLGITIESEDPKFCVNGILLEFDMIRRGKND